MRKPLKSIDNDLWKSCDDALAMSPRTQNKRLLEQYEIIGEQFRKKFGVYKRDILGSVIFVSIVIFCPQLINSGSSMISWMPQIEAINNFIQYVPFISILICSLIFSNALLFMVKASWKKSKAQSYLLECIHSQKKNYRFFDKIKRNENRNSKMMPLVPTVIGVIVTVVITIFGMIIKADPAWACVPAITIAGTSISSIVIFQKNTFNSDVNINRQLKTLELEEKSSLTKEETIK